MVKDAHVLPILAGLKKRPDGENDEKLKDRLHSTAAIMDDFLAHLVDCRECLTAVNHFFLTLPCGHILTPKAAKVLNLRRTTLEDGIYLIGVEVPPKATLQYHDVTLIFIAPLLEIHQAVRRFRNSVVDADLPHFSDIGVESRKLPLYRMSSQGHYERFRGGKYEMHGKRTVVDVLARPPSHQMYVGSQ